MARSELVVRIVDLLGPLAFSTRHRIPQFTTKYLVSYALFLHCDTFSLLILLLLAQNAQR